ncbi:MAG: enoyl-CoA hydratase/isomerase family protein, partial [Clostridiales Family XIII bacterium]|nr:enoyl-CoA hydratase/isomerase family protein [Clostridiales Family XIII bacterium]
GIAFEAEAMTIAFGSEDRVEGMSAFLEKRPAQFQSK